MRDLIRFVVDVVFALFGACLMIGCSGGGDGSAGVSHGTTPRIESPQSVSVVLTHGDGYECFALDVSSDVKDLWCRRTIDVSLSNDYTNSIGKLDHDVMDLLRDSETFVRVLRGDITALHFRDDTICAEAYVSERPTARTPGQAFYCWGEHALSVTQGLFTPGGAVAIATGRTIVYGGPNFAPGVNDSPSDLIYGDGSVATYGDEHPYGGDMTLDFLLNQTLYVPEILTDSLGSVSDEVLSCEISGDVLECPDFSVSL